MQRLSNERFLLFLPTRLNMKFAAEHSLKGNMPTLQQLRHAIFGIHGPISEALKPLPRIYERHQPQG